MSALYSMKAIHSQGLMQTHGRCVVAPHVPGCHRDAMGPGCLRSTSLDIIPRRRRASWPPQHATRQHTPKPASATAATLRSAWSALGATCQGPLRRSTRPWRQGAGRPPWCAPSQAASSARRPAGGPSSGAGSRRAGGAVPPRREVAGGAGTSTGPRGGGARSPPAPGARGGGASVARAWCPWGVRARAPGRRRPVAGRGRGPARTPSAARLVRRGAEAGVGGAVSHLGGARAWRGAGWWWAVATARGGAQSPWPGGGPPPSGPARPAETKGAGPGRCATRDGSPGTPGGGIGPRRSSPARVGAGTRR